jgi:hydroxymethylpyrimidine/phosphomethylpyrimidine kinase
VLIPRALIITPNLPEAAALLDSDLAEDENVMRHQARRLLSLGAKAVLLKGGHAHGPESADVLIDADGDERLSAERVPTQSTHGTGCTLSSAIAAGLAKGFALREAVRAAKSYVTAAIAAAETLAVGSGHGPVHHFHRWW